MKSSFTFKIGGPAGYGIMTTGLMFSKLAVRGGYHIFDYVEYPSLIRGGHNVMETHFAKEKVYAQEKGVDLLVALNKDTVLLHTHEIKKNGAVLFGEEIVSIDPSEKRDDISYFPLHIKNILSLYKLPQIVENMITLGAASCLFGFAIDTLYSVIEDVFEKKGKEVVKQNKKAAYAGYEEVRKKKYELNSIKGKLTPPTTIQKTYAVLSGNEAVGIGAIKGGCQFYVAYPMTPSSSVLHYLAAHAVSQGIVVRHAEDEIGVINEALGASFAGVRSMLGTSGGGFALMNEAISLSGVTETPIVIFVAQRPGPATGMPTWTEQGDLQFVIHAGHGEFPKIVLAPGDVYEAFYLTAKALNLADMYQTPVIVLTDKYLSESHQSVPKEDILHATISIDRGKYDIKGKDDAPSYFPRYKDEKDGISVRTVPGTKGYYFQANSYEHLENGHTTEDSKERIKQVQKRFRKQTTYLSRDFKLPRVYGDKNADRAIIAWGSVKLPIMETLTSHQYTIGGKSYKLIHFTHVWPLDSNKIKEILMNEKRLLLIENNSQAQFGNVIAQETGIRIEEKLLKYDGRPFYPDEIITWLQGL